jgi:hypothetical protein
MALPGLAADAVAKLLTSTGKCTTAGIKRADGKDATAFADQAKGLTAMRSEVIALREEVTALKAQLPFPQGSS